LAEIELIGGSAAQGRQTNQNPALYESARAAFGQPKNAELSLGLPNVIIPTVALDPDSPPIIQAKGQFHFNTPAGGAGTRSELVIGNIGGAPNAVIRAVIYAIGDGVNGFDFRGGVQTTVAAAITRWGNFANPPLDSRWVPSGAPFQSTFAPVYIGQQNALAAFGTPGTQIGVNTFAYGAGTLIPFGPVWLAPISFVLIRPTADVVALKGWVDWAYYSGGR
jgi:hypothetical protein